MIASTEDPAVVIDGLTKHYGRIRALAGLELKIPRGTVFGILGPNGAGKSTLIKCLAGLVRPDSGRLSVLGFDYPSHAREASPSIGYMPQSFALYPELSVAENLDFFARVFGMSRRADRKARVAEIAALVALEDRLDSPVQELSGGMRQRASLACALVHKPGLLLLDEPTVGIDPALRRGFWEHFHSLAESGVSVLVSSHVMDEAERCDTLAMIMEGKVLAVGNAAELKNRAGVERLEDAFLAFEGGKA